MGRINLTRVLLGGLAGGLIINASEYVLNEVVLKADWQAAMSALGRPAEMTGNQIGLFTFMSFALGISVIWLYAAIRPRLGSGLKTAAVAAVFVWFVGYLLAFIPPVALGLFTTNIVCMGLTWGFLEVLVASMVGARIYRD